MTDPAPWKNGEPDWTRCLNCGTQHSGLKFVVSCQGGKLRCPDCRGKMRDMTPDEIATALAGDKETT